MNPYQPSPLAAIVFYCRAQQLPGNTLATANIPVTCHVGKLLDVSYIKQGCKRNVQLNIPLKTTSPSRLLANCPDSDLNTVTLQWLNKRNLKERSMRLHPLPNENRSRSWSAGGGFPKYEMDRDKLLLIRRPLIPSS